MNNLPHGDSDSPKQSPISSNTIFSADRIMRITSEEWRVARTKEMEGVNIMTGEEIIRGFFDDAAMMTDTRLEGVRYSEELISPDQKEGEVNPENLDSRVTNKEKSISGINLLRNAIENYFAGKSPKMSKDKEMINKFLNRTPFEGILDMDYGPAIRLVGKRIPVENFYGSMKGVQASYAFLAILAGIHKTANAKRYVGGAGDINTERLHGIIESISRQGEVSIGSVVSTAAHFAQSHKATSGDSVNYQQRINNSSSDTVVPRLPQ